MLPPGVLAPLIAVNTLRPKKNGRPKSNDWVFEFGAARFTKAMPFGLSLKSETALATLKSIVVVAPLAPVIVDCALSVEGGQKNPGALVPLLQTAMLLSTK